MLKSLTERYPENIYVLVAQESHEDGNKHLHALVCFKKEKNFKATNCFDIDNHHPNIQSCRSLEASYLYVMKDGEYVEQGTKPFSITRLLKKSGVEKDKHAEMIQCASRESLLKYCINNSISPGYYHEAKKIFDKDYETIEEDCKGELIDEFNWMDYTTKTTILWGKSGVGKTTWAINNMPKPILFVTHIDTLKKFNPEFHKSILFDDMDFKHYPLTAQIHIVDQDQPRQINIRYGRAIIPANTPKVFTCNEYPFQREEAIQRRVISHYFGIDGKHSFQ